MNSTSRNRTLAQQLSRAFVLFGSLVAAGFCLVAAMYGVRWAWLTPEFERSRLAVTSENAAYIAMLDKETGLRGYLLTGDVDFLADHTRAESALVRANEALSRSTGAVAEVSSEMLGTRLAQERWNDRWARGVNRYAARRDQAVDIGRQSAL
jgi:CHASE3 domain sensor protein